LERFLIEQTGLAQAMSGIFPAVIVGENQSMSYLFMDFYRNQAVWEFLSPRQQKRYEINRYEKLD